MRVVNEWDKTRSGFKHTSHLFINNHEVGKVKENYYNRTWESYTYESVMIRLRESFKGQLTDMQKEKLDAIIKQGRD